ncbi:MAG: hypothetical protein NTW21_39895 [Verrucomicrobia bacterium]|nr:hypothetical protein [Verrucomicrobiota bacterium]
MNSVTLNNLIDSIRSLLAGRPANAAAELVAHEYAQQCRVVNERLVRIAPILDGGGEIQALQLAEQPPRVLDLAITLSFGGEAEWQEYCLDNGLEVAPLIDARTLEALQTIQQKGVSHNHPLYRDYRAAISSRNEAKAYELIRIITRLNPGDENAALEIKRLERKTLQAALTELRAAIAANQHDEVLAIMPRVEQAGAPMAYELLAEWQEAVSIRQRHRREEARRRMPELLLKAEEEMQSGNWRQAAVLHGEFSLLFEAHGAGSQALEMIERAKSMDACLATHRSEAERLTRVKQLVTQMLQSVEEVATRGEMPLGITPEFAGPVLDGLVRKWREVEHLQGEVPAASRARIEATRTRLAQAIERGRSSRRLRRIVVAGVGLLLLLVVVGLVTLNLRAAARARMLAELQHQESCAALRDLLDRVKDQEPLLLRFAGLSTAAADAGRWLETTDALAKLTEQELGRLEIARENNFAELASPALCAHWKEIGSMVAKLPADLKHSARARLSVLSSEVERTLQERQETADREAREAMEHWNGVLEATDFKESANATMEAIKDFANAIDPFLAQAKFEESVLRLPAGTAEEIRRLDSRCRKLREQAEGVAHTLATLEGAENPGAYREALKTLSEGGFKEASAARLVLEAWLKDDCVVAFLLYRNDLEMLKAERQAAANRAADPSASRLDLPVPEEANKWDREVLDELRNSETLNGLWDLEVQRGNGPIQKFLSKGALQHFAQNESWKGLAAEYPTNAGGGKIEFKNVNFNRSNEFKVKSNRLSPVAEMMKQLDLAAVLNNSGDRFSASIVPLVDQVTRAKDASPLARAYVLERLFTLIAGREPAWGLHLCPEWAKDFKAFSDLKLSWPFSDKAWLLQDKPKNFKPWEAYFAGRKGTLSAFLRDMKDAADKVLGKPIMLAGRVDQDGKVILQKAKTSRLLIGIGETQPGVPGFCLAGIAEAHAVAFASPVALVPLSPLLCFDMPRSDQEFLKAVHAAQVP